MAEDKKKRTTSPDERRAALRAHPKLIEQFQREDEAREWLKKAASGLFGPKPTPTSTSLRQRSVQAIAKDIFPNGYGNITPKQLVKDVTDEQKRRNQPICKRDVILRALGRRKG
jgi:hypothetical protein